MDALVQAKLNPTRHTANSPQSTLGVSYINVASCERVHSLRNRAADRIHDAVINWIDHVVANPVAKAAGTERISKIGRIVENVWIWVLRLGTQGPTRKRIPTQEPPDARIVVAGTEVVQLAVPLPLLAGEQPVVVAGPGLRLRLLTKVPLREPLGPQPQSGWSRSLVLPAGLFVRCLAET